MADLLHQADTAGLARAVMLRAIQKRANSNDDTAVADICSALEDIDQIYATGDWFGLVRRAFWLAERAGRRSA